MSLRVLRIAGVRVRVVGRVHVRGQAAWRQGSWPAHAQVRAPAFGCGLCMCGTDKRSAP